jgi:cyclopropane fatty-acyl-phospholipid synthase-like methyltransferase
MAGAHEKDTGFYDRTYEHSSDELYAAIRAEAFGDEIGQFSWLTADEYRQFFEWLDLDATSHVLEVASGSGGPALFMASETGCRVTGLDIHEAGVTAATALARERGLDERAHFVCSDARDPLPFDDGSFDALTCIDSFNHVYEREQVLLEWHRVLRPRARMLFTDPITLTGMIRREEMIVRSGSMGEFVFTAPGLVPRLVEAAGFVDVRVEDVTDNMADVAARWHATRAIHADELDRIEGADRNASFQHFLEVVDTLARERRLSRFAYLATKPS